MQGADAVVNCVGTFARGGKNNFGAVQAEAPGRIARIAAALGVGQMVHISAIGAAADSPSIYGKSKAEGEAAVLAAFPAAVILRPSVVFGPEDQFFNRFGAMAAISPVLPVAKAETKFQPVYVDDVAQAAVKGSLGQAAPGVYELGGPDVASFRALMHKMLAVIQRRRLVVSMPTILMKVMAFSFDMLEAGTLGLVKNKLITRDQLNSLGVDNVVAPGAKGLIDLGIQPTSMDSVLPEYLWPYRKTGQFAAVKASAKNLKKV
jgi:NADH dehydrogenase